MCPFDIGVGEWSQEVGSHDQRGDGEIAAQVEAAFELGPVLATGVSLRQQQSAVIGGRRQLQIPLGQETPHFINRVCLQKVFQLRQPELNGGTGRIGIALEVLLERGI